MFNKVFIALMTAGFATAATFSNPKGALAENPTVELTKVPGTTPNLGIRGLTVRQTTPGMVFCTAANCAAGCLEFPIGPLDVCLIPTGAVPYNSLFISNPSGVALGATTVGVGSACTALVAVPAQNTCFNISPAGQVVAFF